MSGPGSGRNTRRDVVESVKQDMQEPLMALQVLLEALEGDEVPIELRSRMRAHTQVLRRRLALLADDLDLVSHLDLHSPRLVLQDIDLESILIDAAGVFPDMVIHLESAPHLHVRADALRLRQILHNIIGNARRRGSRPLFMYAAEESLTVTLRVRDPGPRHGREMFMVDLLVRAQGGRTSHDEISESFVMSLPRATSAVRPRPDLMPSA